MSHWREKAVLLVSDFLAINAATVVLLWMKFVGGALTTVEQSWRLSHPDPGTGPTFAYALKYYSDGALPLIFLCWLVLFILLGMYGIDGFTAIINPPESAILALGRVVETPVGVDGEVVLRPMARFTLSADHRLVDGVAAARFMGHLREALERPEGLL